MDIYSYTLIKERRFPVSVPIWFSLQLWEENTAISQWISIKEILFPVAGTKNVDYLSIPSV